MVKVGQYWHSMDDSSRVVVVRDIIDGFVLYGRPGNDTTFEIELESFKIRYRRVKDELTSEEGTTIM